MNGNALYYIYPNFFLIISISFFQIHYINNLSSQRKKENSRRSHEISDISLKILGVFTEK